MNFCAFVAVRVISEDALSLVAVWPLAIAFGLFVGFVNGSVVVWFRIPPIIGTLAVGFVALTAVQIVSAEGATTIANRGATEVMRANLLGVPIPFLIVILVGLAMQVVLRRTAFGRELLAVGQSRRAARLVGIGVSRTIFLAYLVSGALAGLTGAMLATSVGSADLELGNPFLLMSVGAVVLGGNRISGGTASVLGTVLGAILLTLLALAVTVAGLPIEAKNIAVGLVITLVLVFAAPGAAGRAAGWTRLLRKGHQS
jgi:ribose transport system permease protein